MDHLDQLQRAVTALGTLPVQGLVTTGPAIDPHQIDAPDGVTVVRSAPHRQVLAHTDVLLTHGGHGTIMKGLVADVPIVCMPTGRDQPDNAARLIHRGAGLKISKKASPTTIAAAIEQVGTHRRIASRRRRRIAVADVQYFPGPLAPGRGQLRRFFAVQLHQGQRHFANDLHDAGGPFVDEDPDPHHVALHRGDDLPRSLDIHAARALRREIEPQVTDAEGGATHGVPWPREPADLDRRHARSSLSLAPGSAARSNDSPTRKPSKPAAASRRTSLAR